jgi:hypothetical protein
VAQHATPNVTAIRLPGIFKVEYGWWTQLRWAVPIDAGRTRNFNWAIETGSAVDKAMFALHLRL